MGDCDKDSDCPDGMKCGNRIAGKDNYEKERRLDGELITSKSRDKQNRDYCYDPNHASLKGPLVPTGECATFNQKFPCMTKTMYTGPHSDACYQDLWRKSHCIGQFKKRLSDPLVVKLGNNIKTSWSNKGYKKVYNEMQTYADKALSREYEKAKIWNKLCYGKDIDPCDMKFINKSVGRKRPQVCIDKLWAQTGLPNNAKLAPKNIPKWKNKPGSGIGDTWENGLYYDWTPNNY